MGADEAKARALEIVRDQQAEADRRAALEQQGPDASGRFGRMVTAGAVDFRQLSGLMQFRSEPPFLKYLRDQVTGWRLLCDLHAWKRDHSGSKWRSSYMRRSWIEPISQALGRECPPDEAEHVAIVYDAQAHAVCGAVRAWVEYLHNLAAWNHYGDADALRPLPPRLRRPSQVDGIEAEAARLWSAWKTENPT